MVRYVCYQCRKTADAPPESVGELATCPHCGARAVVPRPPAFLRVFGLIASLSGLMSALVLGIGGGVLGFAAGILWWMMCGMATQPDEHAKWVAHHFPETIGLFTLIPAVIGAILGGVVLPLLIMVIGMIWKACRSSPAGE